jgi:hypothetical protein
MTGKGLASLVRTYNAAITRASKKGIPLEALPQKMTVEQIRHKIAIKEITERSAIADLKRMTKKGATNLVKLGDIQVTAALKTTVLNNYKRTNRQLQRQREKAQSKRATLNGAELGYKRELMEDTRTAEIRDLPKPKPKSFQELDMYIRGMDKKKEAAQGDKYKENFILAALLNLGIEAFPLVKALEGISGSDILDLYYTEESFTIDMVYTAAEAESAVEKLLNTLERLGHRRQSEEYSKEFIERQQSRLNEYIERT